MSYSAIAGLVLFAVLCMVVAARISNRPYRRRDNASGTGSSWVDSDGCDGGGGDGGD
ncbi:hypothetical protein IMCC21224_11502 [Puniceibacterium sp. IMCC21224]|nr:hypothetical protein IMCC21224_11502 [Puniceibacterium sp. IMCC21224]